MKGTKLCAFEKVSGMIGVLEIRYQLVGAGFREFWFFFFFFSRVDLVFFHNT